MTRPPSPESPPPAPLSADTFSSDHFMKLILMHERMLEHMDKYETKTSDVIIKLMDQVINLTMRLEKLEKTTDE